MTTINGTSNDDSLIGGAGADSISGLTGNDTITGGAGNDTVDGGAGTNTAVFSGKFSDYLITPGAQDPTVLTIVDQNLNDGDDGTDTLSNIQNLSFADGTYQVTGVSKGDTQVNTYTAGDQRGPSIQKLADGGYVISWESNGQDSSGWGIYAQRYSALGSKIGSEFQVNMTTYSDQATWTDDPPIIHAIAALKDGGFVISWLSYQDGSAWGVYAQRYDVNGAKVGGEFLVNTTTANGQINPSLAGLADGGFIATWQSEAQDGASWGVYAQRYDVNGAKVGSEFLVNSAHTLDAQYQQYITPLSTGGFVIAWRDNSGDGSYGGVRAQIYGADGQAIGADSFLNSYTNDWQHRPSLTPLSDGGFIATWVSNGQDGWAEGVYGQRFSATGAKVGLEFLVNTTTSGSQTTANVSSFDDGSFVVVWQSNSGGADNSDWGIYAQRFDANGNKLGGELLVNSVTTSAQINPVVTALYDGNFVTAWESYNQDGSGWSIQSRTWSVVGGFNTSGADSITIQGNNQNNNISQLSANVIDGGAGADTMEGGTGNTVYVVDNAGDVVRESANGGQDEVRSSITYTLSDNVENLTLTGTENLNGFGNSLANIIVGNASNNSINGGAGNDTITGGAGDDSIDGGAGDDSIDSGAGNDSINGGNGNDTINGGAGINTLVLSGSRLDYIIPGVINLDNSGFTIKATADAILAGNLDGVDTLSNIQKILFAGETDPVFQTITLDDYSNIKDTGNTQVQYGVKYSGIINFKNDTDHFNLTTVAGQSIQVVNENIPFWSQRLVISNLGDYGWGGGIWSSVARETGVQDLVEYVDWNYTSSRPLSYNFTVRREWIGTDGNDTYDYAQSDSAHQFEHLTGGAGNDSLTGGAVSDSIEGGSGNDTLKGNAGSDFIDGGTGINTVVYNGNKADYSIAFQGSSTWLVTNLNGGADGIDTVKNVQVLQFADGNIQLDDYSNDRGDPGTPVITFGSFITGTANFAGDSDWFQFDFGKLGIGKSLKITLDGGGAGQRFTIYDADGNQLFFKNANNEDVTWISSGQSYVLTPDRWGPNSEGGQFIGGKGWVQAYADSAQADGTRYTISIARYLEGTSGSDNLSTGTSFDEINGAAGNDTITGSSNSDRLFGGAGNDSLVGAAGDDFLSGGAGNNIVLGGAGNDTIDVSGRTTVLDTIEGGEGIDTLQISQGVVFSGATISGIEILSSSNGGTFNLTPAQLISSGITTLANLNLGLVVAGTLDAQNLNGSFGLVGTSGNDVLIGGAGNNVLMSLQGNDTVIGGAGDDTILFQTYADDWQSVNNFLQANSVNHSYVLQGSLDGGVGSNTLKFDFQAAYWASQAWGGYIRDNSYYAIDISQASVSNINSLAISTSYSLPTIIMTTSELGDFTSLGGITSLQLVGGGFIDLNATLGKGITTLSFGDGANYTISGGSASDTILDSAGNDQLIGAGGDDRLTATSGVDTLLGGSGNDTLIVSGKSAILDILDGGEGVNSLQLQGQDVDLSGATLVNINKIEAYSSSLAITQTQYDLYRTNLSGPASLILKMTQSGTSDMKDLPANFIGISGTDSNDTLNGGTGNDLLVGAGGNDSLSGGDGNDRLVTGSGTDTLSGGAGNDTLVVTGKQTLYDQLSGGLGLDTLLVSDGQDLTNASIGDIETLQGAGTVTLTDRQLATFTVIDGVSVQLTGTSTSYTNPNLQLINGAKILLPQFDPLTIADSGIIGSKGDDNIVGGSGADSISGGRGADSIDGGTGNDTIVGGGGADTISGGAGNDSFIVNGSEFTNYQTLRSDVVDGGDGIDTLAINFNGTNSSAYFIDTGSVINIENLIVSTLGQYTSPWNNLVTTASEWQSFVKLKFTSDTLNYPYYASVTINGDGSNISLASVDDASKICKLNLNGNFANLDLSKIIIFAGGDVYNNNITINSNVFDSVKLSSGSDVLFVNGNDQNYSIDAGDGNDRVRITGTSKLSGSIEGGAGNDVLDLSSGNGFIDLTGLTLSNIESVNYGATTVLLTATQLDLWSLDGTGSKFTKTGDTIVGSTGADSFSGHGSEFFQGGRGDDTISNVNTVVFTGNYADYDFTRTGTTLTVQQARGSMTDGIDILTSVMNLQFGGASGTTVLKIDDAPDSIYPFLSATPESWRSFGDGNFADLVNAAYGKPITGKKDFASDVDILASNFAPNSPLSVEASSFNGANWSLTFFDRATGQQFLFKNLTNGSFSGAFNNWMNSADRWLPGFGWGDSFKAYQGGDVVFQVGVGGGIQDYAFTLNFLDDFAGSANTLGQMDPVAGSIQGYIGTAADSDWIRTTLIAGTKYDFHLNGVSSGGGTLVDPKLQLMDSQGRLISAGIDLIANGVGNDDEILFNPNDTGTYYLAVSDVAGLNTGSWTLTQKSLDTIAGNVSTTQRIQWSTSNLFTISSEINALSDHDWFKVWLDKGLTYKFKETGTSSSGGTLSDPQLSLMSGTGILLALDDNSGGGTDAQLVYSATDSGWYFLDAGASGNSSKGTYTIKGSTLADDYANTVFTTGIVQTGIPIQGLVTYAGDSDWFKVGLSKGKTYVIDLTGDVSSSAQLDPLADPLLVIHDANGNVIGKADDFAGSLNSKAYFTATTDGLYYLEAKSSFKYDIGAYQLSVSLAPPDDFINTETSGASLLTLGQAQIGTIGIPGDRDVFQLSLQANKVYQISLNGLSGHAGSLVDPFLRVFDSQGHLVDFDNNSGAGNDAQLYFTPTTAGTYYFEASANHDVGMGTYQIVAAQRDLPPDDVANNISTQVFLNPGDSRIGSLLTHNDQDWFGIKLVSGQDYVFRVRASESGQGSLADPVLEIHAADGTLIRSVDNMLISNEPATVFTPTASGTYYLSVRAHDGLADTGTYTLVTRSPDDYSNTRNGAAHINMGDTLDGAIQWSDGDYGVRAIDTTGLATDSDEDWFTFSAVKDQILSVSVKIAQGSLLSRPMLEVVDSQGRSLAIGDGLETNNGAAVATFKAVSDGEYFARVIDGAGATGTYQINLAAGDASDEDATNPVAMNFATNGGVIKAESTAKIGLPGDTDVFNISVVQDHTYRIETLAVRDGTHAPLGGSTLNVGFTANGSNTSQAVDIIHDIAMPSAFDSTVFQASSSGSLSISVKALDLTQTGAYKVVLTDLGTSQADDHPDVVLKYVDANHGVLAAGDTINGKIDDSTDVDLFAINLTAGNIYDFSIKGFTDNLGTLAQGDLKLLDASGNLVTVGDFDSASGRTGLPVSVFESGRYYLSVSAPQVAGNIGTYTLDTRLRDSSAQVVDDISADSRSGVSVAPGRMATGAINYVGDKDWIKADLVAGKVYVLDVLANGSGSGGTLKDSTLRLLDSSGNEVAFDDNSGAGLDSHLQITAANTGSYYLEVGSNGTEVGAYSVRLRELYSGIADPLKSAQWYLNAIGLDALQGQITGTGVTIGLIDDGIDYLHPDLQNQIDYAHSYDTVYDTQTGAVKIPYPTIPTGDFHGTAVAGIMVAQQNNETGIVGIAPDADVASVRVKWTWDQITQALGQQYQFDISNNSWGAINPFGDNFNSTTLTFAYQALRTGVEDGRGGLGTIFVFSAGNNAAYGDNTNYHNFQNAREVITVGAVDQANMAAAFSTPGASVLIGAYGVDLLTTDRHEPGLGLNTTGNYTQFSGTSAAAPVISGVVALMLEANPNLGYRDVQQILALSASHPDTMTWKINGASEWNLGGLKYNDLVGFGVVDAYSAVCLAQTWMDCSTAINEVSASARSFGLGVSIPDGSSAYTKTFHIDNAIKVEHVELGVDLTHTRLGDLIIQITSADGTVSTLMDRPTVNTEQPFGLSGADSGVPTHLLWDFSSVQFMGEEAAGDWTVTVRDVRAEEAGILNSLSLRVYGAADLGNNTYVFTEEGFKAQSGSLLSDESGTDTLNASPMLHDMYINLLEGTISAETVTDQIASWTVIEKVISGSGNDRIVGNAVDNLLDGRQGSDTIEGGFGNDTINGGDGADSVIYQGKMAEYGLAWNPNTKILTVTDNAPSNGNDGIDSLRNVENLVFSDGQINLGKIEGNHAPTVTKSVFANPVVVDKGIGINYSIPETAIVDADTGGSDNLQFSVSSSSGGELPSWLSFDPVTKQLIGVPPADYQGQLKLLVSAVDEFGTSASDVLTLQFGANQAPTLDAPSTVSVLEDAGLVALHISAPVDPEGKSVTVTILDIPSIGIVLDKSGNIVTVGSVLSADGLTELHYQTALDANGDAGFLHYEAKDADGVTSDSSVHLYVEAVNDAPRFADPAGSKLVINYPSQSIVSLDVQSPIDPESNISSVKVIDLPTIGTISLDGQALHLNDVLTLDQLKRLSFALGENVNGPIGSITIQAVDPQGLATNWSLALEVQGAAYSNVGTSSDDAIYGSIGNDTLYGMGGNDTLAGNAGNDRLLGGTGNDSIFGGSGNDSLDGSSGNDYLDGGTGADIMNGGPGNDTYIVDNASDLVLEAIAGGAGGKDLILTSITIVAPDNVESLQANSGSAIDLTGNSLDNVLIGNELSNILLGSAGRDTLIGGLGNDTLDGGVGVDKMSGGAGDDTYFVDSKSDTIVELSNEGRDVVKASTSYTLSSNVEDLFLLDGGDYSGAGNSLNNHIYGNSSSNILAGGLGADTLEGGLGNDVYVLSDSLDVIIDTGGLDSIRSPLDVDLQKYAGIENIELVGIADTSATGNAANNLIIGNMGNNVLDGLGGVDTLTGGDGSDQFVIAYNGAGLKTDVLTDFTSGSDLLILDIASFGVSPSQLGLLSSGTVDPTSFISGAGSVPLTPNHHFMFDTASGMLRFDADGNGLAKAIDLVQFAATSSANLKAQDIYVVI